MKSNHAYATLVAGVLAALLGTGCDWSSTYVLISPSGGVILFGTRWEVTEVDGVAATVTPPADLGLETAPAMAAAATDPPPADLGFETPKRIAGSSGCNWYVAELNASQTTVRIGSVAGTRM